MRIHTRAFFNEQWKTRSMTQAMNPKAAPKFDEVKVPGGNVDWRVNKKVVPIHCWPVVVRISRTKIKGEYYKSVHAVCVAPESSHCADTLQSWVVLSAVLSQFLAPCK